MKRTRSRTAAALGAVLLGAAAFSGPVQATDQRWQVTWRDDFSGGLDGWIVDTGSGYPGGPAAWGTGEVQAYTPDAVALDGRGHLTITPRRDAAGAWTSGRVETKRSDFRAPDGGVLRIEGRLRLPEVSGDAALGYWSAFWALGAPFRGDYWNWPQVGEVDIAENVNGVDRVWGVLHCGDCAEPVGLGGTADCGSCRSEFHTYRFEWDRGGPSDRLRWYVDERLFHSVDESEVEPSAWASMSSHDGFFVVLNVAVGGGFPTGVAGVPTPTATTEPAHPLVVDYVSVSTRAGR